MARPVRSLYELDTRTASMLSGWCWALEGRLIALPWVNMSRLGFSPDIARLQAYFEGEMSLVVQGDSCVQDRQHVTGDEIFA